LYNEIEIDNPLWGDGVEAYGNSDIKISEFSGTDVQKDIISGLEKWRVRYIVVLNYTEIIESHGNAVYASYLYSYITNNYRMEDSWRVSVGAFSSDVGVEIFYRSAGWAS